MLRTILAGPACAKSPGPGEQPAWQRLSKLAFPECDMLPTRQDGIPPGARQVAPVIQIQILLSIAGKRPDVIDTFVVPRMGTMKRGFFMARRHMSRM